jgi:hypothetical protein
VSIRIDLTELEATVIETLLREAATALEDEIDWAEEHQDWEEYDAVVAEYSFLSEIASSVQVQLGQVADEDAYA